MCDKCPKELCRKPYTKDAIPYSFKGSNNHIHPGCWLSSKFFLIEKNENSTNPKGFHAADETLLGAIMLLLGREDTTLEDAIQLSKIRSML